MSTKAFEDTRWSTTPQKKEFRHERALFLTQKGPVLDVGCGDGLMLSSYKEQGIEAEGVDLSDVAVTLCTSKGLNATQGDFTTTSFPFANSSFQTVLALDVLEHVYNPDYVLAEIARVTKSDVIISVPNFSSFPARLQVLFGKVPENNRPNKGHVYWFTWHVLKSLLRKHNLQLDVITVNTPWERYTFVGSVIKLLGKIFPSFFALSFVVRCKKQSV